MACLFMSTFHANPSRAALVAAGHVPSRVASVAAGHTSSLSGKICRSGRSTGFQEFYLSLEGLKGLSPLSVPNLPRSPQRERIADTELRCTLPLSQNSVCDSSLDVQVWRIRMLSLAQFASGIREAPVELWERFIQIAPGTDVGQNQQD